VPLLSISDHEPSRVEHAEEDHDEKDEASKGIVALRSSNSALQINQTNSTEDLPVNPYPSPDVSVG